MKTNKTLDNPIYYGTEIPIVRRANILRKEMTDAESILWSKIRRRQLQGCRFRRQHPINQFIADFYCHEKKLVIEVDGGYHNEPTQNEHDQQRTYELEKLGLHVLRFSNDEVKKNLNVVIGKIIESLSSLDPIPIPSPNREGS